MTRIKFLLVAISLIIADQLSKYIIRHSGGFYICNPGIAFGLNISGWIFWILIVAIIVFLFLFKVFQIPPNPPFPKGEKIHNTYPIILILSGALSNLIDRLRYGCVIDFIDLKFWPVFNLADAFITIGGIMIIVKALNSKFKITNPK
ncbi:signal peptidase II [bacterium]|nr:signal peptidase II [bacterium]